MRTFQYHGYGADGSARNGQVEADGRKLALRELAARGIFVESLEAVRPGRGLDVVRRAALYREVSALLGAGLPLERALQLLMGAEGAADPALAATLAPVRDAVRDGQSVAAALGSVDARMEAYERAALEAAERTATLPAMLERIAEFLDSRRAVVDRLRSAAIYPVFVLALGLGVAVLMLGVLVPKAQAALRAGGVVLPQVSLTVVALARGVVWGAVALLALGGGGMVAVSGLCRRDPAWKARVDRWRLSVPVLGPILRKLAAARFASTLSVLTRSGVPWVEGLALAGSATGNRWLAERFAAEAGQVRHGRSLGEAVAAVEPLAGALTEWVRVGEAGGCLDTMLDAAARREQAGWERAMTRMLALFEPAVLLLVGVFVLAVALAVLLPVTALTRAIG